MTRHYSVQEEKELQENVRRGEVPICPRCGEPFHVTAVPPDSRVAYVRRRVILQCSICHRRAVMESKPEPS